MTLATALFCRLLLRGWGYNVALANSGRQALEQVREQVFDLVLCDVRMAEMDGIATLKEIKALNPAIPVLIMTAYSSVEDGGRGTENWGAGLSHQAAGFR
ncbi:two-component system response regulator [Escherichia coli]|uniref:Two-component system response regulator n=1 Tax=Escherichia coli TaxID=562 RepID=A0A2X3JU35_ECOLX|nr:two-component system response regulator [Escherichia coli]